MNSTITYNFVVTFAAMESAQLAAAAVGRHSNSLAFSEK
jgi:hypothetical protein